MKKCVITAYEISSCCLSLSKLITLGKYQNLHRFSCSVRKNYCTTNLLLCMTSITACPDVYFNCLVKFCTCCLLYKRNRICYIILYCSIY